MRHLQIFSVVMILLIPMAFAAGRQSPSQPASLPDAAARSVSDHEAPNRPSEDWDRVRTLAHDEEINVWASHNRHVRCLFTGATDDLLFCEPRYNPQDVGEYRFDRADVDKVRLEQGEQRFKTTVGVMALLGTIAGAALNPGKNNVGERALGGLAGGLVGAGPVVMLIPGHLIYERPRAPKTSHAKARAPRSSDVRPPQEAQ
jgi:hypothetical protein